MYVCICNALTERHVHEARHRGATSVSQVFRACDASVECGKCATCVRSVLKTQEAPVITAQGLVEARA